MLQSLPSFSSMSDECLSDLCVLSVHRGKINGINTKSDFVNKLIEGTPVAHKVSVK